LILLDVFFKFIISYYFKYAFIFIKANNYYFYLFFVRNDFKEIVGDKDSQGSQTDFDWQKRGKIDRNSHQDIDRYNDFFLAFSRY